MFDVTNDVINYFEAETRNEEEFQKIWAELAKWKTDRDQRIKEQEEEERKHKEQAAREAVIADLRDKAAAAVARYTVELFKDTDRPRTFDGVYQYQLEKYKKGEQAIKSVKALDQLFKDGSADKKICKNADKSQSDEEKLEEFLRKAGLLK